MITIDVERCTGCAACVEVCPTGALYLVDGKAAVDRALCHECEACLAACPNGAITLTEQEEPMTEPARLPARRAEPEVIRVSTQAAPVPFRSRVFPLIGSALVWAEREILPLLADWLDRQEQRTAQLAVRERARRDETLASGVEGSGRQHRHRRRGGSGPR